MAVECEVEGCTLPRRKREWCGRHYQMWRRTGDPATPPSYTRAPLGGCCWECGAERLMAGSRRFCSVRCQGLDARRRRGDNITNEVSCIDCGQAVDITPRPGVRKQRSDMTHCPSCRARRTFRQKGRSGAYASVGLVRRMLGDRCGICTEPVDFDRRAPDPEAPSIDHVVPLSRGGATDWSNCQLSHLRCNQVKGRSVDGRVA